MTLTLQTDTIEAVVEPARGADVTSLRDLRSGRELLFVTPWKGARSRPGADSTEGWLADYPGGWQLLLPNGGDACEHDRAPHGFHGEASIAGWEVLSAGDARARLRTRLFSLPLVIEREVAVDGAVLTITDTVENAGAGACEVMWGHHPAFGETFLAEGCVLETGARSIVADERVDGTLAPRDAGGPWQPPDGAAVLAYLTDFDEGWATLWREDRALGVALRWDAAMFPCMWLWLENRGSSGWPWFGRARALGLEPHSSWPGHGIAEVARRGGNLVSLAAGERRSAAVRAEVLAP